MEERQRKFRDEVRSSRRQSSLEKIRPKNLQKWSEHRGPAGGSSGPEGTVCKGKPGKEAGAGVGTKGRLVAGGRRQLASWASLPSTAETCSPPQPPGEPVGPETCTSLETLLKPRFLRANPTASLSVGLVGLRLLTNPQGAEAPEHDRSVRFCITQVPWRRTLGTEAPPPGPDHLHQRTKADSPRH